MTDGISRMPEVSFNNQDNQEEPKKRFLSASEILATNDAVINEVYIPEWQGSVFVKTISGRDAERYELRVMNNKDNFRAYLVMLSACDENGNCIFSEKDVMVLGSKSSSAIHRIFEAARRLNKIGDEEQEGLEKNSISGT